MSTKGNMPLASEQNSHHKIGENDEEIPTTNLRYAGYASKIKTALASAHRYVAYTSDIGESFRPVAHPYLITSAYGISWAYIIGDVAYEGWKVRNSQQQKRLEIDPPTKDENHSDLLDWRVAMVKRAMFQSIASMGLPALTIHTTVRYAGKGLKNVKNKNIRSYGPVGLGLLVVPALPFVFDEPVERGLDRIFEVAMNNINQQK